MKFGIDATRDRLHLGHFVQLRLCRALQARGHALDLVLGTLTGQLGDPSGRDRTRPVLSADEVRDNADGLLAQCERVLLPTFRVHRNHELARDLSVPDFLVRLAGRFTVAGLLARDGFRRRMEADHPIAAHELLVPLLQGWDSVVLRSEVEIGGTDQLFNFQIARALQRAEGLPVQDVLMLPLIRGTDGRKMSKSFGNAVWIDEPPDEMFGQVMSVPDDVMEEWLPVLTDLADLPEHPMARKKTLAADIVRQLHGGEAAEAAEASFARTVQRKELPEVRTELASSDLVTLVAAARSTSRSRARQLLESGGVRIGEQIVRDPSRVAAPGEVVRIGRRLAVRVVDRLPD